MMNLLPLSSTDATWHWSRASSRGSCQRAGRGLAVPGMPVGSPGMEMGGRKDKYDVLLFDAAGKTRVYASR